MPGASGAAISALRSHFMAAVHQEQDADSPVLVSWIAVNNDPYERDRTARQFRLVNGGPVAGPTLTLLFDPESRFCGQIHEAVFFVRDPRLGGDSHEMSALQETLHALVEREPGFRSHVHQWKGEDPTDHKAIYEFAREAIGKTRVQFPNRKLVVHISPGTPSMQTVWVLMGETGLIEPPYCLVKSYRPNERRGHGAVEAVDVGVETFYKAYRAASAFRSAQREESVFWDPKRFQSSLLVDLYIEAARFARLRVPVLLLGERGTGKTTLAAWMRAASPFRSKDKDQRWAAVACGQYTAETMRAEMFGYRKGAFTGAIQDRPGLLAVAHDDTLFLDEIGDISRDLQRLLIKVIEDHKYYPLGDDRPRDSNFRLIAATNRSSTDLASRVDADFLDRVGTIRLRVPALREVPADIGWIWRTVYDTARIRSGGRAAEAQCTDGQHESIVRTLRRSHLPGNLRDLFRIAYRLIAAGDSLSPLPNDIRVEYALATLDSEKSISENTDEREVARRFADLRGLDGIVAPEAPLRTRNVERALKQYLAHELRRLARAQGVNVGTLCDVDERSLRAWLGRNVTS
jgi:DNA-binding NtrC family response regulator